MYGIVRSMVKVIELGRNDLTPQIDIQPKSKLTASKEFLSNPTKINEAILLYRQTYSLSEVSRFTGLSNSFIHGWLKSIGEHKPQCPSYSSICLPFSKQIIDSYKSGVSCFEIGKLLNLNEQAVRKLIKDMGLLKDTKPYQKLIDHNWLDDIDGEEKAYFLGLHAADGWVFGNSLCIGLQQKDQNLLETLKQRIVPFIPLAQYAARPQNVDNHVRLVITSRKWRERCEELLIGQRKSLTMPDLVENIPEDVRHHFIRGYFDGDGSVGVYLNKRLNKKFSRVQFLGTKEFLTGVHKSIGIPVGTISLSPKEKIHRLSYSGKQRLFEIRDYLYKDSTIFLSRKKDKFVW